MTRVFFVCSQSSLYKLLLRPGAKGLIWDQVTRMPWTFWWSMETTLVFCETVSHRIFLARPSPRHYLSAHNQITFGRAILVIDARNKKIDHNLRPKFWEDSLWSAQSVPSSQSLYREPGPPSSQITKPMEFGTRGQDNYRFRSLHRIFCSITKVSRWYCYRTTRRSCYTRAGIGRTYYSYIHFWKIVNVTKHLCNEHPLTFNQHRDKCCFIRYCKWSIFLNNILRVATHPLPASSPYSRPLTSVWI